MVSAHETQRAITPVCEEENTRGTGCQKMVWKNVALTAGMRDKQKFVDEGHDIADAVRLPVGGWKNLIRRL